MNIFYDAKFFLRLVIYNHATKPFRKHTASVVHKYVFHKKPTWKHKQNKQINR